jgi:hypothetical protein
MVHRLVQAVLRGLAVVMMMHSSMIMDKGDTDKVGQISSASIEKMYMRCVCLYHIQTAQSPHNTEMQNQRRIQRGRPKKGEVVFEGESWTLLSFTAHPKIDAILRNKTIDRKGSVRVKRKVQ